MKTALLALAIALSTQTFAEEISAWNCPASIDGNAEKIGLEIDNLVAQNNLETAAQLASNCATFGSNIDVSLIMPILDGFHFALEGKLNGQELEVLNRFLGNCADKGEQSGGSLGRAMAAHCQLSVYEGFYSAVKSWDEGSAEEEAPTLQ